jgi:hypothetical protein
VEHEGVSMKGREPEDIAARLDEIMQTDGHWIPATIGEEQASVAEVLRARPG